MYGSRADRDYLRTREKGSKSRVEYTSNTVQNFVGQQNTTGGTQPNIRYSRPPYGRQNPARAVNRYNGSRQKHTGKIRPMQRWSTKGITIGSVNIRGLTYCKLLMLMEVEEVDILCVQETWMAEGALIPEIPGYRVME